MLAYVYWIITVSFKAAAPLLVHSHAPIGALPGQPRQGCVCFFDWLRDWQARGSAPTAWVRSKPYRPSAWVRVTPTVRQPGCGRTFAWPGCWVSHGGLSGVSERLSGIALTMAQPGSRGRNTFFQTVSLGAGRPYSPTAWVRDDLTQSKRPLWQF